MQTEKSIDDYDFKHSTAAADYEGGRDARRFAVWVGKILNSCDVSSEVKLSVGFDVLDLHWQGKYLTEQNIRDRADAASDLAKAVSS